MSLSKFLSSSVCFFCSEILTVGTEGMESVPVKVAFLLWHGDRRVEGCFSWSGSWKQSGVSGVPASGTS